MDIIPIKFLREGIKAVPAVKYALGVGAIAAVLAIIQMFGLKSDLAFFGTIIIIGLMFVLFVFASLTKPKNPRVIRTAGFMLTWVFSILIATVSTFLVTGLIFGWPKSVAELFSTPPLAVFQQIVQGIVTDSNGINIEGAKITIDANPFQATSGTDGTFMSTLRGVKPDDTVTIRVYHPELKSCFKDFQVKDLNKTIKFAPERIVK